MLEMFLSYSITLFLLSDCSKLALFLPDLGPSYSLLSPGPLHDHPNPLLTFTQSFSNPFAT